MVVVDGARADDGHQAVVGAVQHAADLLARGLDQRFHAGRDRQVFQQHGGRDQRADGGDAHVVDAGGVVGGVAERGFGVGAHVRVR